MRIVVKEQRMEKHLGGTRQKFEAWIRETIGDDILTQGSSAGLGNVVRHFGYDGHGSTRLPIDDSGAIQAIYAYDAHGNAENFSASSAATKYLYAGQQYDANFGLCYFRARYYDPTNGRFILPGFPGRGRR